MAKKKARVKRKLFDPYGPTFKYQDQFNKAVNRRARGQLQPDLNTISQDRLLGRRRHAGRTGEIRNFFGAEQTALGDASNRVNDSLSKIIAQTSGLMGASSDAYASALRGGSDAERAAAAQLGLGANPADQGRSAAYATAADVGSRSLSAGLGSQLGSLAGDVASRVGVAGTAQREASEAESQRFRGVNEGLDAQKHDLLARLPQLREDARKAILDEIRGADAQRTQQDLARDQFDLQKHDSGVQNRLATRAQDEAETQGAHNRVMDRKNFRLNTAQLGLQRDQLTQQIIEAGGANAEKNAEAAGKQFDQAAQWLTGYLSPGDQDKSVDPNTDKEIFDPKKWRHNRRFFDAYNIIQNRFGMTPIDAARVLSTSNIREWRIKAKQTIKRLTGTISRPGNAPSGGSGGPGESRPT